MSQEITLQQIFKIPQNEEKCVETARHLEKKSYEWPSDIPSFLERNNCRENGA